MDIFGIKQMSCYVSFELSGSDSKNKDTVVNKCNLGLCLSANDNCCGEKFPYQRRGPISLPSSGKQRFEGDKDFLVCEHIVTVEVVADRDGYRSKVGACGSISYVAQV